MAPGVLVAQAIGRWGNWFNQELFGRPTDLPWAPGDRRRPPAARATPTSHDVPPDVPLRVPVVPGGVRRSSSGPTAGSGSATAGCVALYVMVYTLGRGWIEMLRIDDVQLDDVLGLRFNVWTSIVLFVLAAVYFVVSAPAPPRPRGDGRTSTARDTPEPTTVRDALTATETRRSSAGLTG